MATHVAEGLVGRRRRLRACVRPLNILRNGGKLPALHCCCAALVFRAVNIASSNIADKVVSGISLHILQLPIRSSSELATCECAQILTCQVVDSSIT